MEGEILSPQIWKLMSGEVKSTRREDLSICKVRTRIQARSPRHFEVDDIRVGYQRPSSSSGISGVSPLLAQEGSSHLVSHSP